MPLHVPLALMRCRWLLAGAVVLALAWPLGGRAQDMDAHLQASQAFDAWRAAHPDRMPRLADAEAASWLRTLSDATRFLPSSRHADLTALSETCDRAQSAVVAYLVFGAMRNGQLAPEAMGQNAISYQDELALLQPFLARCVARQVPLAEAAMGQLDPATLGQLRLGGLRRGQTVVSQLYASLATALAQPRIGAPYIDALLGALAETAPAHARALPVASRAAPRTLATEQLAKPGPRQAQWQRVYQAMSDGSCHALCELASRGIGGR